MITAIELKRLQFIFFAVHDDCSFCIRELWNVHSRKQELIRKRISDCNTNDVLSETFLDITYILDTNGHHPARVPSNCNKAKNVCSVNSAGFIQRQI